MCQLWGPWMDKRSWRLRFWVETKKEMSKRQRRYPRAERIRVYQGALDRERQEVIPHC